jgi:Flp pilus assembly protein TadG
MTRNRRGQALVEFALVLPMVLALVIAIFEIARAWNIQQVITDAAREGARVAVIGSGNNGTPAAIATQVDNTIDNALTAAGIDPNTATVTTSGLGLGRGVDAVVGISIPYQFVFLSPMMRLLSQFAGGGNSGFNGTINLQTSFTMRNE